MRTRVIIAIFLAALGGLFIWSRYLGGGGFVEPTFTEACLKDGNMWHKMSPIRQGVASEGEAQLGCMTADGANHFSDYGEYKSAKTPGESDVTFARAEYRAGEPSVLNFSVRSPDGSVPELYKEHERYLHVIIISRDMSVFSHIHPDDQPGFSSAAMEKGEFSVPYVFPKSGEYIIAVDYANRLKHESRQFRVTVAGEPVQAAVPELSKSPATFAGFTVSLDHSIAVEDSVTTLRYAVRRGESDVVDMIPYLGAAMHVAVVKNDLSEFIHTHGEWHPPGYVAPQNVSLSHVHVPPPEKFGPTIEAHVLFPNTGRYTVFGEFKRGSAVVLTKFTIEVR